MQARLPAALLLLIVLPTLALAAQGVPAGFAPTSVFASKTTAVAGETISLFTVLYNSSAESLSGDVVFTIDGKDVGTKHFSLAAGETQTPSVTWTAAQGSHAASAQLKNIVATDSNVSLLNDKADTITITVSAPPQPTPTQEAVQTATNVAQQATPVVQSLLNSVEHVRQQAVDALQNTLAASTPQHQGAVLGASTGPTPQGGALGNVWNMLLRTLLFICQVKYLFYALLLVVIYCVYKLIQMLFRGTRAY